MSAALCRLRPVHGKVLRRVSAKMVLRCVGAVPCIRAISQMIVHRGSGMQFLHRMSALPPIADIRTSPRYAQRSSSGSLAMFAAIRRASSRVECPLCAKSGSNRAKRLPPHHCHIGLIKCFEYAPAWGSGPSMADYYSAIANAISRSSSQTDEARRAI
jgi:hypothetical protein